MSDDHDDLHATSPEAASNRDTSRAKGRTLAEWVTLAISVTIVLSILGLVTLLYIRGDEEQAIVLADARVEEIRHKGDAYYVPVEVTNDGDRTVEDVVVEAELVVDDQTETAEITFTFLAGGERLTGAFIFSDDPSQGELTVRPVSYKDP